MYCLTDKNEPTPRHFQELNTKNGLQRHCMHTCHFSMALLPSHTTCSEAPICHHEIGTVGTMFRIHKTSVDNGPFSSSLGTFGKPCLQITTHGDKVLNFLVLASERGPARSLPSIIGFPAVPIRDWSLACLPTIGLMLV